MKKVIASLGLAAVALTGCASSGGGSYAPSDNGHGNWVHVDHDPQGWVWTICDHGNRLYDDTAGNSNSLAVVAKDPTCSQS